MQLREFIAHNGIDVRAFARAVGVRSLTTIYRYLRGERIPRPRTMDRIEKLTKGAVTLADCYAAYKTAHEKPTIPNK